MLQRDHPDPNDWWAFAADLHGLSDARFKDQQVAPMLPIIGDALDDHEIRALMAHLLDNTKGAFRHALGDRAKGRSADTVASTMTRAELLQALLLVDDGIVQSGLDELVSTTVVQVPPGEIRRPVSTRHMRSGAFAMSAEVSHLGSRFRSTDPGVALLRLRRLLGALYLPSIDTDTEESSGNCEASTCRIFRKG